MTAAFRAPDYLSILLLEGDRSACQSIESMLQMAGSPVFRVEAFRSLGEAVQRLEAARFDLLLLDLGLSGVQGLATLLRAHDGKMPIVAIVASADMAMGERALEAGAAGYLVRELLTPGMLRRSLPPGRMRRAN